MSAVQRQYQWKAITVRGAHGVTYFLNENDIHPDNVKIVYHGPAPIAWREETDALFTIFFYPSPEKLGR